MFKLRQYLPMFFMKELIENQSSHGEEARRMSEATGNCRFGLTDGLGIYSRSGAVEIIVTKYKCFYTWIGNEVFVPDDLWWTICYKRSDAKERRVSNKV